MIIGDLIYVAKTLVVTAVVVTVMQVKFGERTLEDHTMTWVYESEYTQPIHEVAQGGVAFLRDLWVKIDGRFDKKVMNDFRESNRPGSRTLGVKIERSKRYIEDKALKAAEKLQKEMNASKSDEAQEASSF